MEDIRRKLAEETKLYAVKGGQARRIPPKNPPVSTGDSSIITISSTESSPVSEKPGPPSSSPSKTTQVLDIDDISSDGSEDVNFARSRPKKSKPKRLILSDDESEPEPQPTKTKPTLPPMASPSKSEAPAFSRPPTSIMAPVTPKIQRTHIFPSSGPVWETFDNPEVDRLYDPIKTAAEAERDLQDLLAGSMNDNNTEIDMKLATVKGFHEDIKLLPHQVLGRIWMTERETGKKTGGILADDMGLGKTIQTLTRIVDGRPHKSDKYAGYAASTLVVCPVALVSQWASEIMKMAVGLKVIEHHGPSRTTNPEALMRTHVVVTSYSVLSSEHGSYEQRLQDNAKSKAKPKSKKDDSSDESESSDSEPPFGKTAAAKAAAKGTGKKQKKIMDALFHIKWWRIVLDEAHNIKNRKTKSALACCALEGKYRWALTGTPMQNNVEELYSLLKFLRIRPLNDWETFNNQINKPVKSGKSVRAMKRLQVVLQAIMLRRKKDALLNGKPLLELPDRIVDIVPCEFDADEREFYESIQSKVELTLNRFRQMGDVAKNYTSVLVLLLRLRQACNHPSLLSKDFALDKEAIDPKAAKEGKDIDDADDLVDLFGQMGVSSGKKCQMCQLSLTASNSRDPLESQFCSECEVLATKSKGKASIGDSSLPPESAKIRMIMKLLREIRERPDGQKTIIFSQFTSMLDIIQPFLRNEGIKYVRYDGSMRKDQREESLSEIRESPSVKVILISFKAGSTGLNLTACNNVILVDMWWNPALEDQAFDRAHRFGQTRNVNIYKLTIERTVEERILHLQEKKRELADAALSGDKLKNARLGLDDLMSLFRYEHFDNEEEDDD